MKIKSKDGITLIECLLALALGALILASLTTVFSIAMKSWREGNNLSELVQHSRVAMARVTSELRYATRAIDLGANVVEFDTTNLVDSDAGVETIKYQLTGGILYRSVDGGTAYEVAGSASDNISVSSFTSTGLKLDGSNNLVLLDIADSLGLAVAVRIDMTLTDADGENLSLSSAVNLRNNI